MATIRQKKAFEVALEAAQSGETLSVGEIMRRAGYSPKSAVHPKVLTESKGWTELLADIPDEPLLLRLTEIALDRDDKRACIDAIKELFKLKDRYPAAKQLVQGENGLPVMLTIIHDLNEGKND